MKAKLKKFNDCVMNVFGKWLVVMGITITVTVFVNVVCRYVFLMTIPWAEELARFLFIWMTFVGSILANNKYQHMRLDFVVEKFSPQVAQILIGISYIIVICFLVILCIGGTEYSLSQWDWKSSALGVRHGLVYIIAPISFFIMGLQYVARLIDLIINVVKGEISTC
ncbi:MAG: TRAP transporter small permease [Spirochaetaceae bacterium]|nr:TRAP transporter small permease [Spirochaetaceae bacterium]